MENLTMLRHLGELLPLKRYYDEHKDEMGFKVEFLALNLRELKLVTISEIAKTVRQMHVNFA